MPKVLISTVPFGEKDKFPLELLSNNSIEYILNPLNRKLKEDDLKGLIGNMDGLIAGTEIISDKVLKKANNLKIISRVGIGLDGIDLNYAKEKNINISYTPDAPGPAVAEMTIGLMISLLRSLHISNSQMHLGKWNRIFGRRISEITIGIIGVGRIGSRVLRRLKPFGTPKILVNDVMPDHTIDGYLKVHWTTKNEIYKNADLISLHLPLNTKTKDMITAKELSLMKDNALLINTSRGGIINEKDLFSALKKGKLGGAAIDVFENEPYAGPLKNIERCLLTSHMGSMSEDCRTRMEIESTEEIVRFFNNEQLKNPVPESEYNIQKGF